MRMSQTAQAPTSADRRRVWTEEENQGLWDTLQAWTATEDSGFTEMQ